MTEPQRIGEILPGAIRGINARMERQRLIDNPIHRRRLQSAVENYEKLRESTLHPGDENNEPEGQLELFEANVRSRH